MSRMAAALAARNAAAAAGGRFAGRSAVVVGGTAGIGEGCALALARAGHSVTIVGRDASRGAEVVRLLALESASCAPSATHAFIVAARSDAPLDVLVLTQGIATTQGFTPTAEGIDQKMALHVFSRFACVDALLPALRAAKSPHVLTVLSAGVHSDSDEVSARLFADPLLEKPGSYTLRAAASANGLYTDVLVEGLALAAPNLAVIHASPGLVSTSWGTELPLLMRLLVRGLQALPFFWSLRECGEAMCAPILAAQLPSDALASVAGAGRPGCYLMGADAQPVKESLVHASAREPLMRSAREVLGRLRPQGLHPLF